MGIPAKGKLFSCFKVFLLELKWCLCSLKKELGGITSSPHFKEVLWRREKPWKQTRLEWVPFFSTDGNAEVEGNQGHHVAFHKVCLWVRRDLIRTSATQRAKVSSSGYSGRLPLSQPVNLLRCVTSGGSGGMVRVCLTLWSSAPEFVQPGERVWLLMLLQQPPPKSELMDLKTRYLRNLSFFDTVATAERVYVHLVSVYFFLLSFSPFQPLIKQWHYFQIKFYKMNIGVVKKRSKFT